MTIIGKNIVRNMTDKTAPCFSVSFSAVAVSEILLGSVKREKKDRSKKMCDEIYRYMK